jgi:hypothetical protein
LDVVADVVGRLARLGVLAPESWLVVGLVNERTR